MTSKIVKRIRKKFSVTDEQIMEAICNIRSSSFAYDEVADYISLYMSNEDLYNFIASFPVIFLNLANGLRTEGAMFKECYSQGMNIYFPSEKYKAKFLLKHGPF